MTSARLTVDELTPAEPERRRGLRIPVVSAVGHGRTPISSFDHALWRSGIANYNLLPMTSVIPPGSEVVVGARCDRPPEEFGHKLFVVKAEARSVLPGAVVAAGLAWAQWGDGRGVFVEHHAEACGESPEAVEAALSEHLLAALRDLCAVRGVVYEEPRVRSRVAVARVGREATTALVVAAYQAEGWR